MKLGMTVKIILLLSLLFSLTACGAQRPVLYPNEHFKQVGSNLAERSIDDCIRRAEGYVSSGEEEVAGKAAVGVGTTATVGAAAGAAGGAVVGSAGRGAAAGAAGGAAAELTLALLRGLFEPRQPSPSYRAFVDRCLREKGYDPIGWK